MKKCLLLLITLGLPLSATHADVVKPRTEVVQLWSPDGAERFRRSGSTPETLALISFDTTEERLTFCGPPSLSIALNSLGIRKPTPVEMYPYALMSQASLFTEKNQEIKSYAKVEASGLTLDQLGKFAENMAEFTPDHKLEVDVIHATANKQGELRDRMRVALAAKATRVIVNYARKVVGQDGEGHISPVAAYDAPSDSFLVLDVARYKKYGPVWISYDTLFAAMNEKDPNSGIERGLLIISRPGSAGLPNADEKP